ncbi:Uncharacterised protein [Vibrio cholerae]|nr:Uncharacterised protein [Vibrio cholerae]
MIACSALNSLAYTANSRLFLNKSRAIVTRSESLDVTLIIKTGKR